MRFIKRLFFKVLKPQFIRAFDYASTYKSQWSDGGVPVETFEKQFDKDFLHQLVDKKYFNIDDESIGIDDYARKVYNLTPKARTIAKKPKDPHEPNSDIYKQLFWWLMGVFGSIIAGFILAYIFGVGR
ncbi:hypothetical protein B7Y94_00885 [Candidatus Saccharibacteria bacterium 32-49-12]|nr:MAG: hypothetical protein B7Y94_00885 [Candidatus Saccharibacteria bacterium 32-49-12]